MSAWEKWLLIGIAAWFLLAIIAAPIIGRILRKSREAAEALERGLRQAERGCGR